MPSHNRRARRGARLRIVVAVSALALTFGAVRFLDLGSLFPESTAPATADTVSQSLALPFMGVAGDDSTAVPLADPRTTSATPVNATPVESVAMSDDGAQSDAVPSLLDEAIATSPVVVAGVFEPEVPTADNIAVSEPTDIIDEAPASTPVAEATPQAVWIEHRIEKGESLARIFKDQGLDASLLHRIVNSSDEAKSLAKIRPGQLLRFQYDDNRELERLELHRNRVESLRVAISDDTISAEEVSKDVERAVASTGGVIESSLFLDGQKAGLSETKIMELAAIFGWDIDFALEIRAGDQFRVLFEEHYLDGEKLRDGPILAAEFTNRGTTFRAVRYEDSNGEVGYFDDQGHSKRRAFLRTPIKFARISSRFNPKRWHPVLKRWRSHKGVDYAAPTGTPIRASGDGRVVFRGTKNGYGNTVILQHAGKYTTLYAHMSGYSKRAKVGTRIKQGQVIGYVGKTGLATGPHLHYEFRVDGVHKDPLRVKLPKSLALPKSEIAAFKKAAQPLLAKLDAVAPETLVARAGATE